jgi:hypothetical protein
MTIAAQVLHGGEAAEAHDVAALKCHGLKAKTNFHLSRCGAPGPAARGARAAAALPAPACHTRPHGAPMGLNILARGASGQLARRC